jgi:hypothetical protein
MVVPDYVEPVVGWRSWAIVQHRGKLRLRSVVFDTLWTPQVELTAGCNRLWTRLRVPRPWRKDCSHDAPVAHCSCGIYATRHPQGAADYLYLYSDVYQPQLRYRAIGRVFLWGSVVEATKGWRAAAAYPERLFLPDADLSGRQEDVELIREGLADYRVPIEILDHESGSDVATAVQRACRKARIPRLRRRRAPTPTG